MVNFRRFNLQIIEAVGILERYNHIVRRGLHQDLCKEFILACEFYDIDTELERYEVNILMFNEIKEKVQGVILHTTLSSNLSWHEYYKTTNPFWRQPNFNKAFGAHISAAITKKAMTQEEYANPITRAYVDEPESTFHKVDIFIFWQLLSYVIDKGYFF